jgi:cyclic peptide transporter
MRKLLFVAFVEVVCVLGSMVCCAAPPEKTQESPGAEIDRQVAALMKEGNIPGLSLVIIEGNRQTIRTFGYADLARKEPVTDRTRFEIGSCSKSFTALAVAKLAHEGKINLDGYVSEYIPWFSTRYKEKAARITVRQLLHHTGGIPWNTIAKIPPGTAPDALEITVRQLVGQELSNPPGKKFEYATINYDVLALIIQQVAGQPFETYLRKHVFEALHLGSTDVGAGGNDPLKATGYKIGFFRPIPYEAPVFRGNNAAGYVISDARDMATWLKFQLGMVYPEKYPLAASTHRRDETVPLHGMSSYAQGWEVALNGSGEIYHGGLNPNYTAYLAFVPAKQIGVAVLANANSAHTELIGNTLMKKLAGGEEPEAYEVGAGSDKTFSILSLMLALYMAVVAAYLVKILLDVARKRRKFAGLPPPVLLRFLLRVVIALPFLYALYLFPQALAGFTWQTIRVWLPASFEYTVGLLLGALAVSYAAVLAGQCYPDENKYRNVIPWLVVASVLSGIANVTVIILLTSSQDTNVETKYLLFYYGLTIALYLYNSRYVQIKLVRYARQLTCEIRVQLIDKILSTSYQRFEKIDRGRIYTALNDDVDTVGDSTGTAVAIITNTITITGIFMYLLFIAFWASVLTILLIVSIGGLYYVVVKKTNVYFEKARDTRNEFMKQLNEMIDGFKEISMHRNKKLAYKQEVTQTAERYRDKVTTAGVRYVNAFLVGESFLVILLGAVAFGFPVLIPSIQSYTIISFIVVILYLIGPINGILNSIPGVARLRIAWNRLHQFLAEIPANEDLERPAPPVQPKVESFRVSGIKYQYRNADGSDNFAVGPVDLEIQAGEVLFIIGGNGSGKTTLAKMLTGLYVPDEGHLLINNEPVGTAGIGEYFSTVFSTPHLFRRLYNVDVDNKMESVRSYLQLLGLESKVKIAGQRYSTIDLSGGQRKRLALLQCYLEDAPIYLFDEWAADQDPEYRHFFYRVLLPEMKKAGKIVIAITHDDHYFDAADKVLKMHQGEQELIIRNPAENNLFDLSLRT